MTSLRQRLVLASALIVLAAVAAAAAVVTVIDHHATVAAIDRTQSAGHRSIRSRGMLLLVAGDEVRERMPPLPDDRAVVAWSVAEPDQAISSGLDLGAADAAVVIAGAEPDQPVTLTLAGGRQVRVRVSEISQWHMRGRRRWANPEDLPPLPVRVAGVLDIEQPLADLDQRRLVLVAAILGAAALAALAAWWVAGRVSRPLARLGAQIAATQTPQAGDTIVVPKAPSELQPVIDRLNDLFARVAAAVARERRVNADIAHELRTPLAGLRSQLEFALADIDDVAGLTEASTTALAITVQLQHLIEALLTMVRLEAGQITAAVTNVAVAPLLTAAWQPLAGQAAERGLELVCDIAADAEVYADPTALRAVMANLLANALAHAPARSHVSVRLVDGDLVVSNPVENPAPDLAERALEPFWRGDQARTGTGVHGGLGLAVAARWCACQHGELRVAVTDGAFVVTVVLPVASV